MQNGQSYNKISGRKTLILVTALIAAIILLSIYSIFLMVKRSAVITNSINYEKPSPAIEKMTDKPTSSFPVRHGD